MEKGSGLSVTIIVIAILAVIGMVGFIFLSSSHQTLPTSPSTDTSSGTPQATVKDFAPKLPMAQKTTILIELSDSSMVKYIVPKAQATTYVKNLPPGYHVVSQNP